MKKILQTDLEVLTKGKDTLSDAITAMKEVLEKTIDRAQEYFDERSEKWQESEKGNAYQSWIDAMEEKLEALDSIESDIDELEFEEIESSENF